MNARDEILARLARAAPAAPAGRPAPPPGCETAERALPAEGVAAAEVTRRGRLFAARLRSAAATVASVADAAAVPGAVADYLAAAGLANRVHVGDLPAAVALRACPRLSCVSGPMAGDGATLVTGCLAAIAEEGLVVLASGPRHAAESAFLAATHVAVVESGQLLGRLEELWGLLRRLGRPPRTLNLILGPSRTADLGVPSRLGAHGPLRLHVVLVGGPFPLMSNDPAR